MFRDLIQNEPILLYGLVETAVALVAAFGLDLSGEQVGALMAFVAAGLSVLARRKVTPEVRAEQREFDAFIRGRSL